MDWHRQGQADANARANDIDRQTADLRAQANRASSWNPFNAERRATNARIDALQASQRSAASATALLQRRQNLRRRQRHRFRSVAEQGFGQRLAAEEGQCCRVGGVDRIEGSAVA